MESIAEPVSGKANQDKTIQYSVFYLTLHLQKGVWLQHMTLHTDIFLAFEACGC